MDLRNNVQVQTFILDEIADEVVRRVSQEILADLRENILKYAYQKDSNVAYYLNGTRTPSFEFLYAFKWDKVRRTFRNIVAELFYDWQSMEYDGESYKHGNAYTSGDHRKNLADTLNSTRFGGYTSTHPWLAKKVKPYWEITMKKLFDGRRIEITINKVTSELSRNLGVKIRKI